MPESAVCILSLVSLPSITAALMEVSASNSVRREIRIGKSVQFFNQRFALELFASSPKAETMKLASEYQVTSDGEPGQSFQATDFAAAVYDLAAMPVRWHRA